MLRKKALYSEKIVIFERAALTARAIHIFVYVEEVVGSLRQ